MIKYTITIMLVATVIVAGIFAFVPINEASTVHTTIQNTQLQIKTITDSETPAGAGVPQARTVTLDLNAPFQLVAFTVECEPGDPATGNDVGFCEAGEDMDIVSLAIDGQADAFIVAILDEPGVSTDDDPAVVLSLFGVDAEASNDGTGLPKFIGAADRIAIGLELDTDALAAADDSFVMTVRFTVLTQGDTAVTAAQIAFT